MFFFEGKCFKKREVVFFVNFAHPLFLARPRNCTPIYSKERA